MESLHVPAAFVDAAEGLPPIVLSISDDAEDHATLKRILTPSPIQLREAFTCNAALRVLSSSRIAAIVTSDKLPDGDWIDILAQIQDRDDPPKLIVASRCADELLWATVLNLGGYDVLIKPFEAEEVRRVLALACSIPVSFRQPVSSLPDRNVVSAAA